jgi:hypothetical protein
LECWGFVFSDNVAAGITLIEGEGRKGEGGVIEETATTPEVGGAEGEGGGGEREGGGEDRKSTPTGKEGERAGRGVIQKVGMLVER